MNDEETRAEIAHYQALIQEYEKLLQKLELQAAKFGSFVPPHVKVEIDDITVKIQDCKKKVLSLTETEKNDAHREQQRTILIVEDDINTLEFIRSSLFNNGFHVLTAYDGLEGLQLATRERPDLVLLDVRIPILDGYEVLLKIKERKIPTRVIILTARNERSDIVKFVKTGACNYITKPFDMEELIIAIRYSLEIDDFIA
jgi:CheY-like chemotaxis protein